MAAGEVYLVINPDPTKQAVHVDKAKYDQIRSAILDNLQEHGPMTFNQLRALIEEQLQEDFDGSVLVYFTAVKLDLEARGEIRRVLKSNLKLIDLNISLKSNFRN